MFDWLFCEEMDIEDVGEVLATGILDDDSEQTGFSASFISNLENGKETAEIGKALYLANLLGLDTEVRERGEK